ncbi:MAG: autoinducer binding domain-containing protein [Rhizobacter sp.]
MTIETPTRPECRLLPPPVPRRPLRSAVRLYDAPPEPVLATPSPANERAMPLPTLLRQLLHADGPGARERLVRTLLAEIGFQWLGYCQVSLQRSQPEPLSYCTTWTDPSWARRYVEEGFFEVDARLHEATRSSLPCVWHVDELERRAPLDAPRARVAHFVAELRRIGMHSGVLFGLPGFRLYERHMVGLLSGRKGSRWLDDGVLEQAWTIALAVHEYQLHCAVDDEPAPLTDQLTPVQTSILRCLATGLGDKGIAAFLGLSVHNVDYHMRQLRKRFGVRNRLQLMQAAARLNTR